MNSSNTLLACPPPVVEKAVPPQLIVLSVWESDSGKKWTGPEILEKRWPLINIKASFSCLRERGGVLAERCLDGFSRIFPFPRLKVEEEYKANDKVVGQKQSNMCAVDGYLGRLRFLAFG
jgi:hypothetical protein